MTLNELIQSLPNWFEKNPQEIFEELSTPSVEFVDKEKWTWGGIADVYILETGKRFGRSGNKLLQDAMLASGELWTVTQLGAGFPLYDEEILELFRQLDASGVVPGARHIANTIKRIISLLEHNNLNSSQEEIFASIKYCKLEKIKQDKIDKVLDAVQVYREAITSWDGNPGTEPQL